MFNLVVTSSLPEYQAVISKEDTLIIIIFSATWCGPCQMLKRVLGNIQDLFKLQNLEGNVLVFECDVDQNSALAQEFQVNSVPTIMSYSYKNGKRVVGFPASPIQSSRQFIEFVKSRI